MPSTTRDMYFQSVREESWALEDGIVKDGAHSIDSGVGVRALAGEKAGFAYSDEVVMPALLEAARAARAIARGGQTAVAAGVARDPAGAVSTCRSIRSRRSMIATRSSCSSEIDREARALDSRISQVMASLAATHDTMLVLASDGTLAADVRPLVRLNVSVIIEHRAGASRVTRAAAVASRTPSSSSPAAGVSSSSEAVRTAQVNLEAVPAPAGTMTVVLGSGWPGVLLHEAVGHGLEGDFNRKGTSAFSGRIGEQVAAKLCTIVDDGTLAARRGSLNVDDEGTPTQCTVLIENGILNGYLQDKLNARLMGVAADRQRPPRSLRAPADAAHDQHLHAAGRARPRGDHRVGRQRHLLPQLRRRPGRHHVRQVRVLGERGVPDRERQGHAAGQGRDADRQRP